MQIPEKLRSRKFWITVFGSIGLILSKEFGVDEQTVSSVTNLLIAGLASLGVVDTAKAMKN